MPKLVPGRVVWATISDPQGRNPKRRRCVVISDLDTIAAGGAIQIVPVTTSIADDFGNEYVRLQHGSNCWTKLTAPSAAHCISLIEIEPRYLAEVTDGFVRPEYLEQIISKLAELDTRVVRHLE